MENKKVIIGALVLTALSFGTGYFATPNKIKIETKEVIKTVTVKEEAKVKIVYKTKIVRVDGTVEETENTREESNTKETADTSSVKESSKVTTKDTGLTLSLLAIQDIKNLSDKREYGLHVTKRVFSNITAGAMVTTDKKVGFSLGLAF